MRPSRPLLGILLGLIFPSQVSAQTPTGDGPITKDTSVGYIDSAVPMSQFRLRFDSAYGFNRPLRDEYFYAKYSGKGGGEGLPLPEKNVDYQELTGYLEGALCERFSLFADMPVRFLNPEFNDNHAGLSDMRAGFKYAFWESDAGMATLLFRTYIPTGNAHLGLGTYHVSFDQGILFNHKLGNYLLLEGETAIWVPVDGDPKFAGSIIRYGVGLSLCRRCTEGFWITPVVECIGWTSLGGGELSVQSLHALSFEDATGDTIVNGKVGVRWGVGPHFDMYTGYGRALTGEVWYSDVVRVEARWKF